jgi:drug resistance transporter, EmrB/QacA subfamily
MSDTATGSARSGYTLLILSISLATFMAALDGTIVNIALPTISEAFNVSTTTVSWVATAYLLVMAGCVLVFGKVSDIIGFKRVFLVGFVIFTLGSLSCGLLPDLLNSLNILIASRMFQAIGGAMITAIGPAMVTAFIPMDQKGKAMGIVMTLAALGTALGPSIGGVLVQYLSWNWIFFINVPIGICAVLLGAKVIPASGSGGSLAGFDRTGALLAFTGLASLLFVVSEGESMGWTSPVILGLSVLTVLLLSAFVWQECRVADPLLDLSLFKNKNFLAINILLSLVFFSYAGINYLLPFYLKYIRDVDTSTAGLVMTALSVAMMAAGMLSGMLFNRVGPKKLCIAAGALLVLGYFCIMRLHADTAMLYVVGCLALIGLGLGLMVTPASNLIMNAVAKTKQGMVSSLTSLERFAPLTLGIAVFNMIFLWGVNTIAANHDVTHLSPVELQKPVISAGFDLAFFGSFVLGIVILVLALVIRQEIHPDNLGKKEEIGPGMI